MLRIRYQSKPDFPGFEYGCTRNEAIQQVHSHMQYFGRETITDESGKSVQREVPASDLIAEWVDGERIELLQIPTPKPKGSVRGSVRKG